MPLHGSMMLAPGYSGYQIDQSMVLDGSSDYLSRTPAGAGDQKTFTISLWVKRCALGVQQSMLRTKSSSGTQFSLSFESDNTLRIYDRISSTNSILQTSAVYRDVGSFYHIVAIRDSTQATASDRWDLYVNGSQITDFGTETYPTLNSDSDCNDATVHWIGANQGSSGYWDGYISEFHFIDGTAYEATDFGEFYNGGNQWRPIQPSGLTYGTNGFYLPFTQNTPNLGVDYSGNGNDWTENGSPVQSSDSPTINYATLNPLAAHTGGNLSDGNTKWDSGGTGTGRYVISTIALTSGKWYVEGQTTAGAGLSFGFVDFQETFDIINTSWFLSLQLTHISVSDNVDDLSIANNGSTTIYTAELTAGNPGLNTPIGLVLNLDDNEIRLIDANGITATARSIPSGITWAFAMGGNGDDGEVFFREEDWTHTPPDGYKAIAAANLPDPTITDPGEYVNAVGYTGDGTAIGSGGKSITGIGFQPDFTWIKNRDKGNSHMLFDVIRGATKVLHSNETAAETTESETLDSFDSDGFTLGSDVEVNTNTEDYISWNWKANGTGVANTDGTISSTVSVNDDAGFSIVSWTLGSTDNQTVGHGLSDAPEFMFLKNRDGSGGWTTYHKDNTSAPETDYLRLDSTAATADSALPWNDTAPTNSVFTIGDVSWFGSASDEMIMYCFRSIPGYSKVFSYTGNGSASDGAFVYLGFKPRFILTKCTSTSGSWSIRDSERDTYNVTDSRIMPDLNNAEVSDWDLDILSNGFKWFDGGNATNGSGQNYIGIAFAETSFGGSNVPLALAR